MKIFIDSFVMRVAHALVPVLGDIRLGAVFVALDRSESESGRRAPARALLPSVEYIAAAAAAGAASTGRAWYPALAPRARAAQAGGGAAFFAFAAAAAAAPHSCRRRPGGAGLVAGRIRLVGRRRRRSPPVPMSSIPSSTRRRLLEARADDTRTSSAGESSLVPICAAAASSSSRRRRRRRRRRAGRRRAQRRAGDVRWCAGAFAALLRSIALVRVHQVGMSAELVRAVDHRPRRYRRLRINLAASVPPFISPAAARRCRGHAAPPPTHPRRRAWSGDTAAVADVGLWRASAATEHTEPAAGCRCHGLEHLQQPNRCCTVCAAPPSKPSHGALCGEDRCAARRLIGMAAARRDGLSSSARRSPIRRCHCRPAHSHAFRREHLHARRPCGRS